MSSISEDVSLSDPYIERLRQKYLMKDNASTSEDPSCGKSGIGMYETLEIPPNPSLTESETRHYNRAMKELNKAFEIGNRELMESVTEYNKAMKSTSDEESQRKTFSGISIEKKCDTSTFGPSVKSNSDSDNMTRSTTLPTLPSSAYTGISETKNEKMSSTFAITEGMLSIPGLHKEFGANSYTDTLSTMDRPLGPADVKAIYAELMSIHQKLQMEKRRIAERQFVEEQLEQNFQERDAELVMREAELLGKEKELLERERALSVAETNMKKTQEITARLEGVELEVQERLDLIQQQHELELERINAGLQEKCREFKRLKTSFDTIKTQNDAFRNQLADVSSDRKQLKTQNNKLKKRLENLQLKQGYKAIKQDLIGPQIARIDKENMDMKSSTKSAAKFERQWGSMFEALAVVLDWISEVHLKNWDRYPPPLLSKSREKESSISKEYLTDKCLKILPMLVDIIRILSSQSLQPKQLLPYLTFAYWSLCHLEDSQHAVLSSTARRLGEELYKPGGSFSASSQKSSASLLLSSGIGSLENTSQELGLNDSKVFRNSYIHSSCARIRLLSSFIILKTLHQVDTLAQVFGQLKKDLKEEINREMFIEYRATHIVLPYITYKANKALMNHGVDLLLQMTMESSLLPSFLDQCSNESWFRAFSSALRPPSSTNKSSPNLITLEKLSIILQKLSKIRSNRKFFDAFSMGRNLQEWYRTCDPKNTFLSLNLRSILFNLNLKTGPSATSEATAN